MTVYFAGEISFGPAESTAFFAAISASLWALRVATFGELAFCHPDESGASIVIEISAEVCVCHCLNPRELKTPSTDSELEKIPAAVSLRFCAMETIPPTEWARSAGVRAAVSLKYRDGKACVTRAFPSESATG